jgi:PAS domain S-box-containing protein
VEKEIKDYASELLARAIEAVELAAHHAFFSTPGSDGHDIQASSTHTDAQRELFRRSDHRETSTWASICASNSCLESSISLLEVVHTLIDEPDAQVTAYQQESRWNKLAVDTKTAGRAAYRAALVLLDPLAATAESETSLTENLGTKLDIASPLRVENAHAKQVTLSSHWKSCKAAGVSARDVIEFMRPIAKQEASSTASAVPVNREGDYARPVLPARPGTQDPNPSPSASHRFHNRGLAMSRILIVEDEGIIALSIKQTLTRLGYSVVGIAGTSEEAIRLAELERPSLVLMDINLGANGDGIDTAALIAGEAQTAIIYLTAYSEDATLVRARETGPYGFLLKPFSERELHATIQMALERHRCDIEIAAKEQTFRLALDAADMGVWELDIESDRLERHGLTDGLLGVQAHSFDGSWNGFLEHVAPEDRDAVRKARFDAVYANGLMAVEFRGVGVDGTKPWLRAQGRVYGQPGATAPQKLIGVTQDIAAQRREGAELHQAAALFRGMHEAAFVADERLRILAVNKAFSEITGHAAADVIGMQIGQWLLRADEAHPSFDLLAELDSHGRWRGEMIGMRQSGIHFSTWLSATRMPGPAGSVNRQIVGTFSDLSTLRAPDLLQLRHERFDTLTGLPNRSLRVEALQRGISDDFELWGAALGAIVADLPIPDKLA